MGSREYAFSTPESVLRITLTLLAMAGLGISAYLTWVHLGNTSPVCVGGGGGCDVVQASRYSESAGVPVALLGVLAYAGMLLAALFSGREAALFGLFVALIGVLFSAYLTYLELFVIRAICQWCVASALVVVAYLALAVARISRANGM